MLAGAVVGAAIGGLNAYMSGGDVGAGVFVGLFQGAIAGLSFGTSLAAGTTIGAIGELINQRINCERFSVSSAAKLFLAGVNGALGSSIGKFWTKAGANSVATASVSALVPGVLATMATARTSQF